ncbi:Stp1/IreP family PP2C-type Ser/Thr phosphatase [bacterium]|nr:Stp1/IreP family PP2C-type Ser/Thr phosphatase [bacterium]
MRILSCCKTDTGKKRTHNEDTHMCDDNLGLFIVADGMGGHAAGDVASKMAVETVAEYMKEALKDPDMTPPFGTDVNLSLDENHIKLAIQQANKKIYQHASSDRNFRGMGTTIVVLFHRNSHFNVAHVGDSRAYQIREGKITLITEDHSWVNEQVRAGLMSKDDARNHYLKNIITRALGSKEEVAIDIQKFEVKENDYYLLCTDGLNNHVSDDEILALIKEENYLLHNSVHKLVQIALDRGGEDNITLALLKCVTDDS